MRVILLRSVDRLGTVGDIVDVADGYARNFLLPRRYGVEATPENIRQLEYKKRKLLAQEAETKQKLQALAAEIAKQSVTILARATEEGHLFGSVTARDVVEAFAAEDIELDPRMVILEQPIKELGRYEVRIRLHPEIETVSKVWVVRADEEEEGAPAETQADSDQQEGGDQKPEEAPEK